MLRGCSQAGDGILEEAGNSMIFINDILLIALSWEELMTIVKEVILLLEHIARFLNKRGNQYATPARRFTTLASW